MVRWGWRAALAGLRRCRRSSSASIWTRADEPPAAWTSRAEAGHRQRATARSLDRGASSLLTAQLHAAGIRRLHLRVLVLPVSRPGAALRSAPGRAPEQPAVAPVDRVDSRSGAGSRIASWPGRGSTFGRRAVPLVGLTLAGVFLSLGARTANAYMAAVSLALSTALVLAVEGPFWATMTEIAGRRSGSGRHHEHGEQHRRAHLARAHPDARRGRRLGERPAGCRGALGRRRSPLARHPSHTRGDAPTRTRASPASGSPGASARPAGSSRAPPARSRSPSRAAGRWPAIDVGRRLLDLDVRRHAFVLDDQAVLGPDREVRRGDAAAVHQHREAEDADEAAPGALADERPELELAEHPRQQVAARAGGLVDDHHLRALDRRDGVLRSAP